MLLHLVTAINYVAHYRSIVQKQAITPFPISTVPDLPRETEGALGGGGLQRPPRHVGWTAAAAAAAAVAATTLTIAPGNTGNSLQGKLTSIMGEMATPNVCTKWSGGDFG